MKLTSTELLERNIFRNFYRFFSTALGPIKEIHGTQYVAGDATFPIFNSVLETNLTDNTLSNTIDAIAQEFQNKHLPCCWWVTSLHQSESLINLLKEKGFQSEEAFIGMAYDLTQTIKTTPEHFAEFEMQRLRKKSQLAEWAECIKIGFELDDRSTEIYTKAFERLFNDERIRHYFVQRDGRIVATGTLFLDQKVSGFYNLAVLPEYRGQQIGAAMKWHRLIESQSLGMDVAVLQSSKMGQSLDKQMGFNPMIRFMPYILGI